MNIYLGNTYLPDFGMYFSGKMNFGLKVILLFLSLGFTLALYGPKSDVVVADDKSFKDEVLKAPGVVMVEFFAPWCGHCKSLTPEYEKAASTLKGVAKLVAVDATQSQSLAQKYGIQGFPTLKLFGADKKTPVDYQGQRTSDGIVTECMKSVNQLVKDRKSGKGSSSSSSHEKPKPSTSSSGNKGGKSDVIELNEANFKSMVLDSNDHWLVEFYAPWCGHCKALAPEWEQAAKQLKGSVKLGAVDATQAQSLASQYGVKGYPTIKVFSAGPKKRAEDYNGPRQASGIVDYALSSLERAGVVPEIKQLTSPSQFSELCVEASGRLCGLLFVPHILDSGAETRNKYLSTLMEVSKSYRSSPITFLWVEAGAQEALETALEINQAYPGLSVLSGEKKVYSSLRLSWSEKNLRTFLSGALGGTERSRSLSSSSLPKIRSTQPWDGKDAVLATEEIPLDELFSD